MNLDFPTAPSSSSDGSADSSSVGSVGAQPASVRPLRILEKGVYRGPHFYSHTPMIRVQVDLGTLESFPTDQIPGFADRLMASLPGLAAHGCSYHQPGGFERRLRDGTWLGHVAEHVALELQTLAGHAMTRGKTRSVKGQPGVYNVMFAYELEEVGLKAGEFALRWVDQLLPANLRGLQGLKVLDRAADGGELNLDAAVSVLKGLVAKGRLGPTTQSLVSEARRRGIPVLRLDDHSLIQLGQGANQRRIRASITSQTSQIAVSNAGDKALTKALLTAAGVPTPRGVVVRSADEAIEAAKRLRFPLVTKPLDGNHGRGVSINLKTPEALRWGFAQAARHSRRIVVEEMLQGRDHRFLVVDGTVVAVAERSPAAVTGNGRDTILDLIADVNRDPRRGAGHEAVMTRIVVDDHVVDQLSQAGLTLQSTPDPGRRVELRATANLSTGGTAIDRTDVTHPDNIAIAEQAAAVIGLDVAGIDFLAPDITRSVRETGGGIVEVNAAPGFRMHLEPSEGTPRNVARPVIASLFPRGAAARIPIFAITGTNGKSTTTRMVAQILRAHGLTVGCTSTTGVYLNDHLIMAADASGPKSARMLLRNPKVEAAVLEVARGGILREGLGFDVCDVGAVLNVTADHLGLKGVDTVEDLAAVKSVVVESVRRRGASVLNADDPLTLRMLRRAGGRPVLFSMHGVALSEPVRAHIARGGLAAVHVAAAGGGDLVLYQDGKATRLMSVADIPATLEGAAGFNVQNALAAAAMTFAHDVPLKAIREGLCKFSSSFSQNPGRLNIFDGHPFRVIMDYAHNPASLGALADLIRRVRPSHRRVIGMVSIPGDRRNEDILTMGRIAASVFDELVFREAPDGRGRATGEVNSLLTDGAIAAGASADRVHRILDERDAAQACLEMARPGDLVVLLPTDVGGVWRQVTDFDPGPVKGPFDRAVAYV
jgi:cyanophycin synthetase